MLEVLLVCICLNFRCYYYTLLCFTTLFSPVLSQECEVSNGRGLGGGGYGNSSTRTAMGGDGIIHLEGSQPVRKAQWTCFTRKCVAGICKMTYFSVQLRQPSRSWWCPVLCEESQCPCGISHVDTASRACGAPLALSITWVHRTQKLLHLVSCVMFRAGDQVRSARSAPAPALCTSVGAGISEKPSPGV